MNFKYFFNTISFSFSSFTTDNPMTKIFSRDLDFTMPYLTIKFTITQHIDNIQRVIKKHVFIPTGKLYL